MFDVEPPMWLAKVGWDCLFSGHGAKGYARWAASAEEIDDLLFWLKDHPEDVDTLARDALARWLFEFRRGANGFPARPLLRNRR
jgi:hypothetical protein